jgi:hypothetical protein
MQGTAGSVSAKKFKAAEPVPAPLLRGDNLLTDCTA